MEKWLVGRGAATSGIYRIFDQEAYIAIVFSECGRVLFSEAAAGVEGGALSVGF
jgi:hypothetical protein